MRERPHSWKGKVREYTGERTQEGFEGDGAGRESVFGQGSVKSCLARPYDFHRGGKNGEEVLGVIIE